MMKRIRRLVRAMAEIISNPRLLNRVLSDDQVWESYLGRSHDGLVQLSVVDISELCTTGYETIHHFAFLDGSCLPTDLVLLQSLSKRFIKCKYFEIGTWRGESVANVAESADICYTLNLSKAEIMSLGYGERYADLHGYFSKGKENIKHLEGNSLTFDFAGLNTKFDLIFIDGNHRYDYVKSDTEKVFAHLIHDQSIVVWHDYAYTPEKVRPEMLAAILDGTPLEFRKYLYHVSNTLCAIFIRSELPVTELKWPVTPRNHFKLKIEMEQINNGYDE